jgi:lipopolysaccharide export system permease protein
MRKSDFWTIFAVCFIPILLAYYPLLMFGVGQAKSGAMPPFIVWLGNVAMLVVGFLLIRQIQRH